MEIRFVANKEASINNEENKHVEAFRARHPRVEENKFPMETPEGAQVRKIDYYDRKGKLTTCVITGYQENGILYPPNHPPSELVEKVRKAFDPEGRVKWPEYDEIKGLGVPDRIEMHETDSSLHKN